MKEKLKNFDELNEHEIELLMNTIVEIIRDEGDMYIKALYRRIEDQLKVNLVGYSITDLINEDLRLQFKGAVKEKIGLTDYELEKPKKIELGALLPRLKDFFENPDLYSWNDVSLLCEQVSRNNFSKEDLKKSMVKAYKKAIDSLI